ncbi:MAG TPA: FAD-binding protein [Chloroflexia bacterium]|nr:FAD-binding protein [Chloroflexia bacterium]
MQIIVPIKQVPESEELRYDPATRTLVREGVASVINPFDKRSLTEAIRLRSLHGGTIVALTMGPPQAREALVECLGRGVDRCVHITDRAFAASDTLATACTLAAALKRLPFDLLLLGKSTTDSETGQVGPELAELLDLPQVTGATSIEMVDEHTLRVTRETDLGFERVECPLPALLTAAEHLIKPAKTKPAVLEEGQRRIAEDPSLIETWNAHDLGILPQDAGLSGSPTWVVDLRPVEVERDRQILAGDTLSSVDSLLLELKERGFGARDTSSNAFRPQPAPLPSPVSDPDPQRSIWSIAEWLPSAGSATPRLRQVSFELASTAARVASEVGGEAVAVLVGHHVEPLASQLAANGASTIVLADDPALASYTTEAYAWVLAEAIKARRPWAVLLPATSFGSDLAPRVAARLNLGLTGDCLGLEVSNEGYLLHLKPAFGGQVVAPIASRTLPQMSTLRPGMLSTYAPDSSRPSIIERLDLTAMPDSRVRILSSTQEGEAGLALDDARLVVCVGMGIGDPEALDVVRDLAGKLGEWMGLSPDEVAVGGTRKVVDAGWLPRHQQVGITGRAVAPDLYLGLGVHGNFNHTVGILRSRIVVSVNSDPDAPIFRASDIGVISNWHSFAETLLSRLSETSYS